MPLPQSMRKIFRLLDTEGRVWQIGEPPPIRGEKEEPSSIVDIQRWRPAPPETAEEKDAQEPADGMLEDQDEIYTVLARFTSEAHPELKESAMEIELREVDVSIVWAIVPWTEVSSEVQERMGG